MGQWDTLKSGSVDRAVRKGLADDLELSHPEVVSIIQSTLSNGIVSGAELDDLTHVAAVSRSISPRSRALLTNFVSQVKTTLGGPGPYWLRTDGHKYAAEMVCEFLKRSPGTYFPKLHRDDVGIGLLMRIANPGLLNQGQASLCGPTALMFNLATDKPAAYVRFAIDLFEKGKAMIWRLQIEPGSDVRNYLPPAGSIPQVDWLTMASIRDSENAFFDYDSVDDEFAGITLPGELAHWFRRAGYSDVTERTNVYFNKGSGTLDEADRLYAAGYRVCLFIGINMLSGSNQTKGSSTAEHWVVLRSRVTRTGGNVSLKVFTWGDGTYQVPQRGTLSEGDFYGNFYGFVAAKP